ncbi:MAG: error-prone DNA polymerase [Rhodospirillaceae bacterium]|nr:error-prone DNA polymerase [Rhodospirillaceae bacterium]
MVKYAELNVLSNFSFLEGGSHPEEIVERAVLLGYRAIALTDRNTLSGVVRFHVAARNLGIQAIIGARIDIEDGASVVCLPTNLAAYGKLTRLLTLGKRRAQKSICQLWRADVAEYALGQILIVLPPTSFDIPNLYMERKKVEEIEREFSAELTNWAELLPGSVYLGTSLRYRGEDVSKLETLHELAQRTGVPMVATNDILYHEPSRRPLQDVLTCIRKQCTISQAGFELEVNAERHLKSPSEMLREFQEYPDAIAKTIDIADRCKFSLADIKYEYPSILTQSGHTAEQELKVRTWEGAKQRYSIDKYPDGIPKAVKKQLEYELTIINKLNYAPYFLTVYDMVSFARNNNILCQGRGSAANSAVCYCLGITAVDPSRSDILFERFVSEARGEPPDIDVDFEHERREEVIQHIYKTYGRERAGLAATVVTFRSRSALREVGKVMGLSESIISALVNQVRGINISEISSEKISEIGLNPSDRTLRLVIKLSKELIGFPRHLSQHVGGFVITRNRLDELVPIENATMYGRTVIEWDKDDLDSLGILKVDVLALGMLSCLQKSFILARRHYGLDLELSNIPAEDSKVYDMLCQGDSLGVFQLESRAQMAMLPRLRPRCFYDLIIEVAIVRPGPIQGKMVHPYIRRRNGDEPIELPSEELRQVLKKTLGIPLFQEQAMKIAIVAAGFTPIEADQLRRAMATFRKTDKIGELGLKMIDGMVKRGYERTFAERCFRQIEGFGNYGFPESHAASFALLVYISSWMKCHMPAVFAAALLNSQPMGFYAPAQIVRDAREHGVIVLPPDVNAIGWDCDLERNSDGSMALRLGMNQIKGLKKEEALLMQENKGKGYNNLSELISRANVTIPTLEILARADAFRSMSLSRRQAFWAVRGLDSSMFKKIQSHNQGLPLFRFAVESCEHVLTNCEPKVSLPIASVGEEVVDDYASLRLSLKSHPVNLLRRDLLTHSYKPISLLKSLNNGDSVSVAGLVLVRQRPSTAKGIIFITIEDETGVANLVVWSLQLQRFRRTVMNAKLLGVTGKLQREGEVVHIISRELYDLTTYLDKLSEKSYHHINFSDNVTHADKPLVVGTSSASSKRVRTSKNKLNTSLNSRDFH